MFTEWNDRLFVRCIPPYILASQRHPEAPRLTPLAKQALARVVELADDPKHHVKMELRPGDMQFINNYHVMHGRTAYADDREPPAGELTGRGPASRRWSRCRRTRVQYGSAARSVQAHQL